MKKLIVFMLLVAQTISAQSLFSEERPQRSFHDDVPPGNYSGIVWLGGDRYAVVSDKSETDGYFIFRIAIDSISGDIKNVTDEGFHSVKAGQSDLEAVAYTADRNRLYLCGEADSRVVEVDVKTGKATGRILDLSHSYPDIQANGGIESFCYDISTHQFWTINERPLKKDMSYDRQCILRLKSFAMDLSPRSTYAYRMDTARADKKSGLHIIGVSELAAMGDGRILVLEREFYVPKVKLGAWCVCKIYEVNPVHGADIGDEAITEQTPFLDKKKVCEWKTTLTLFGRSIANYEGMCLGPTLKDGRRTLLLIADSQNQYRHVLRDWFKSVILSPNTN